MLNIPLAPLSVKHDIKCPACASNMRLKQSVHKENLQFFQCARFPICDHVVSADRNGIPISDSDVDIELRELRLLANTAINALWQKEKTVTLQREARSNTYQFLQKLLKLTPQQAHISQFNKVQCRLIIETLLKKGMQNGIK